MNRVQLRARGAEGTRQLEIFLRLHWGSEGVCQRFPRGAAFFSDSERYIGEDRPIRLALTIRNQYVEEKRAAVGFEADAEC